MGETLRSELGLIVASPATAAAAAGGKGAAGAAAGATAATVTAEAGAGGEDEHGATSTTQRVQFLEHQVSELKQLLRGTLQSNNAPLDGARASD